MSILVGVITYFLITRAILGGVLGFSGDVKTGSISETLDSLSEGGPNSAPPTFFMLAPVVGDLIFWIGALFLLVGLFVYIPAKTGALLASIFTAKASNATGTPDSSAQS